MKKLLFCVLALALASQSAFSQEAEDGASPEGGEGGVVEEALAASDSSGESIPLPQTAETQAASAPSSPKSGPSLSVSGEIKTGLYWSAAEEAVLGENGKYHKEVANDARLHNNDDAGSNEGRFRLNLDLTHGNVGMKVRFEQTVWQDTSMPTWSYAFAYGNFLSEQLKISAGRLGDSPYGSGGPELWKELDTTIGIRTEIKPKFLPGLNIGFVLNKWNGGEVTGEKELIEVLKETVLGLSYEHSWFAFRGAYRLDSDLDANDEELVYRVEERAIQKALPGFQIFANGYYNWINPSEGGRGGSDTEFDSINWLYVQYSPPAFSAQLRFGYELVPDRQIFTVRPTYMHNILGGLLQAGLSVTYAQDFGKNQFYDGSPYYYIEVQPKVQVNLGANFYTALVYDFKQAYLIKDEDITGMSHWLNLRVVYSF